MTHILRSHSRLVVLIAVMICLGALWKFGVFSVSVPDAPKPLLPPESVQAIFDGGDYERSEAEAVRLAEAGDVRFYLLAADSASKLESFDRAREYWAMFDGQAGPLEAAAKLGIANSFYEEGDLTSARSVYEQALEIEPGLAGAHRGLIYLFAMSGMAYEVPEHTRALLLTGNHFLEAIALLADADAVLDPPSHIVGDETTTDPMIQVGFTRRARKTEGLDEAMTFMRKVAKSDRLPPNAYTELGMLWEEDPQKLRTWLENADESCRDVPDFWYLAGRVAEYDELYAEACWCYQQCLDRHYDHLRATYALSQAATRLDQQEAVAVLSARSEKLHEMASRAQRAFVYRDNAGWPKRLAELSEGLGRYWETVAWSEIALKIDPKDAQLQSALRRCIPKLSPRLPLYDAERDKRREMVLAFSKAWDIPKADAPNTKLVYDIILTDDASTAIASSNIQFRDDTQSAELLFSYQDTADVEKVGRRMHEFTGTGVAVIDYDGDLRPDLLFPQSSEAQPGTRFDTNVPDGDTLFRRSLQEEKFIDVTIEAGVVAPGYGQGAATGDFDGDGFPDLYIGQVGRNRLLINNGDGTFRDATNEAGIDATSWSTSIAIVDLNNDGNADLFDVNYLGGPEVYTRTCSDGEQFISCSPLGFPGEPDSLFSGTGTGTVNDVTSDWGIAVPGLNGLGLVVGRFDEDRSLDIFVANDLTENHLFVNAGTAESPAYVDEALFRGAALNRHAETEACMGIAVGDADLDGHIDLFVTNFLEESNTLYKSRDDGSFTDETAAFDLVNEGLPLMGFGTQFIDMDLDGLEDLVISNGHVDKQPGKKFAMVPLAYRQNGSTFEYLPNEVLGGYFMEEFVGRGLARLDWNLDGKDDFLTTHLTSPVRLVSNNTDTNNRAIKVAVRATRTHRDAIGAIIRCRVVDRSNGNARQLMRQITAGDGYMTSNERVATFGLNPDEVIEELAIEWPSGDNQSLGDIPQSGQLLVVEGRDRFAVMPELDYSPAVVN